MGLFSLRKKTPRGQDGSPASIMSGSTMVPSPALTNTPSLPPPKPTLRLRVAIDPLPQEESADDELFYIDVDPDASIDGLRSAISKKTGISSLALFKTRIPWQAQFQARSYMNRYANPVYLMNHFHTWSLDDPAQLIPSLGPLGESVRGHQEGTLRVADWYPAGSGGTDMIEVLACPCPSLPQGERPMTLIAHFAPTDPARTARPSSSSPPQASPKREPAVVHISPKATVDELKAAVLESDGRTPGSLDKVVMWRVEMSEQELVVIEERGGLKGGRMPWPYPPTAPVPTALDEGHQSLQHYFGDFQFDSRMVHLTVWIHPSAAAALAPLLDPRSENAPVFKYPMTFSPVEDPARRVSASHSLPPHSPTVSPPVHETASKVKSRRSRPSTAPATTISPSGTPTGGAPSFGAGSKFGERTAGSQNGSTRNRGARPGPSPLGNKGLGFDLPENGRSHSSPRLDFSALSLSVEIIDPAGEIVSNTSSTAATAPVTPASNGPEWNPSEYRLSAGNVFGSKSKSLGVAARKPGIIPDYA